MLEVAADMGRLWEEGASSITAGMSGLGLGESVTSMSKASAMLQVFAGSMEAISLVMTVLEMRKAAEAAEAATVTAAYSATFNWWPIAIATASAVVAGTAMYALTRTVSANLSNPSERNLSASMAVI